MYTYIHFISFNLVTFFLACFFNFSNLFSIFIFIFSPSPAAAVCRFPSGLELIGSERARQGGAADRGREGNCCISTKAAVAKIIQAKRTTRPAEAKPSPASPRPQPLCSFSFPFCNAKCRWLSYAQSTTKTTVEAATITTTTMGTITTAAAITKQSLGRRS